MSEVYDYPLLVKQLLHSTLQNRAAEEIIYPGVMRYSYREWYARLQRAANAYADGYLSKSQAPCRRSINATVPCAASRAALPPTRGCSWPRRISAG